MNPSPASPSLPASPHSLPKVTVLGLGRMGSAVRGRLTQQRVGVTGWTRSDPASTLAQAVDGAHVVLLCLRDDRAVLDVTHAIRDAVPRGGVVCDLSSVHPETVHRVREILAPATGLVDSPVMGSSDMARSGGLGILAGGSVDDVAAARPVLDRLGTVRHVGPLGTGMALKATLMSGVVPAVTLVHDILTVGRSLGLTMEQIADGLAASPLAPVAARAFSTAADYPVSLAAKDLDLVSRTPGLQLVPECSRVLADAGEPARDLGSWAVRTA